MIRGLFKLDTVSPTACHLCNVLFRGSKLCWPGKLAMPLIYILDVMRDNNEHFFEYLFALSNDAKTC